MARPTTTTAARAVKRNLIPLSLTAFALVLLSALLATQAAAQPQKEPAGAPADVITDAIDYCAWLAQDSLGAEEAMMADGWTIDYSDANGPYVWEVDAYKIYADGTDAYIFALIESYPAGLITYCSYDATAVPTTPDLNTILTEYDVLGEVDDQGSGIVYGTWQENNEDATYFVQANTNADYFFLQMTVVVIDGGTTMGAGGNAK